MELNETELNEMDERATLARESDDPAVKERYGTRASEVDVPSLVKSLRKAYAGEGGGGDFGSMLRDALKDRILVLKGKAQLAGDVTVHSLSVNQITGQSASFVDVRLMVGEQF